MATRGQITEKAVLVHDDEYRKEFPVESYVDETYWADLPFAQRARWMLTQQVRCASAFQKGSDFNTQPACECLAVYTAAASFCSWLKSATRLLLYGGFSSR